MLTLHRFPDEHVPDPDDDQAPDLPTYGRGATPHGGGHT